MADSNRSLLSIVIVLQLCMLLILGLWFGGCIPPPERPIKPHRQEQHAAGKRPRQTVFQHAINVAAQNNPQGVIHSLFALNAENSALEWREKGGVKQVKAVTWMSDSTFDRFYENKTEFTAPDERITEIWVTLAPQVIDFCRSLEVDNPTFRLQQYLGLDPNRFHQRFVEIWVNSEDLFRPCPDPDPTDAGCELQIDHDNPPTVKGIDDYNAFYDSLRHGSYSPTGAPWTRLGYTYDWAFDRFGVGASEYIVKPGSTFFIDGDYATVEYCTQ